jgi:hypothetical protein
MTTPRALLLYSDSQDPVVTAIQGCSDVLGVPLLSLSLRDLCDSVRIFDCFEGHQTCLSWTLPNGIEISNHSNTLLINRLVGVPDSVLERLDPSDRDYAKSEFFAYLLFALNSFEKKTASPSPYGLAGAFLPLPQQWANAGKLFQADTICVPQFYLGDPARNPLVQNPSSIAGDIYDAFQWRPTVNRLGTPQSFTYLRPPGEPVFVHQVCESIQVTTPQGTLLTERTREHLIQATRLFAQHTGSGICETLFFVAQDEITFCAQTPYLASAPINDSFVSLAQEGLRRFCQGGLNA